MIRSITKDDLFNLRTWRNWHREAFFWQDEITEGQQEEWFKEYQKRPGDYMFMVLSGETAIGCMGIRLIDKSWDIYNVILGLPEYRGQGAMSVALKEMIQMARARYPWPVTAKVLTGNQALEWYRKNGFVNVSERKDHILMMYQGDTL